MWEDDCNSLEKEFDILEKRLDALDILEKRLDTLDRIYNAEWKLCTSRTDPPNEKMLYLIKKDILKLDTNMYQLNMTNAVDNSLHNGNAFYSKPKNEIHVVFRSKPIRGIVLELWSMR